MQSFDLEAVSTQLGEFPTNGFCIGNGNIQPADSSGQEVGRAFRAARICFRFGLNRLGKVDRASRSFDELLVKSNDLGGDTRIDQLVGRELREALCPGDEGSGGSNRRQGQPNETGDSF